MFDDHASRAYLSGNCLLRGAFRLRSHPLALSGGILSLSSSGTSSQEVNVRSPPVVSSRILITLLVVARACSNVSAMNGGIQWMGLCRLESWEARVVDSAWVEHTVCLVFDGRINRSACPGPPKPACGIRR